MSNTKHQTARNLRVPYTDKEQVDLAKQLAEAHQTHAQLDADLASVKNDFKSRISAIEAKVSDLSTKVSNGYRIEAVKCEWLFDSPSAGKKSLVRLDTFETVEVTDMVDADKQGDLPLADPDGGTTAKTTVNSDPETGVVTVPADEDDDDDNG